MFGNGIVLLYGVNNDFWGLMAWLGICSLGGIGLLWLLGVSLESLSLEGFGFCPPLFPLLDCL